MQLSEKLDDLKDSIKEYADTNYELIKLEVLESAATLAGSIISVVLVSIMLLFGIFFFSLHAAYYISEQLGSNNLGFSIVGLFYLLLALLIYANRKKLVENTVCNRFIQKRIARQQQYNFNDEGDEKE